MTTQETQGYGVYNWKDNTIEKIRKTKPSDKDLSPYEIPFQISLTAEVPDAETKAISVDLDVGESKIRDAVADEINLGTEDVDEINPENFVFELGKDNYKEKIDSVFNFGFSEDETVEILNQIYAVEVREINRDYVLEYLREKIEAFKDAEKTEDRDFGVGKERDE